MLVGNKCDKPRVITPEEAQGICQRFGVDSYFETSAKSGELVDHVFFTIARRAFNTHRQRPPEIPDQNEPSQKTVTITATATATAP